MAETGFGSPSPGDWGFGSPAPATLDQGETGFGSPYAEVLAVSVAALATDTKYGDDAGYLVEVLGNWPNNGPYRFRLKFGSQLYPETTYCYSAVPTQGYNCYTLSPGPDVIKFALPAAPAEVYDLVIEYGPNFGQTTIVSSALTIVTRNRAREVYALRRMLPEHYRTGAVISRQDPVL